MTEPLFAAAFNTVKNAIRIHRADCNAWVTSSKRPDVFTTWTLEARTVADAYDEIERIIPVIACGCTIVARKRGGTS